MKANEIDRNITRLVDAKTISEMLSISKRGFWRLRAQGKIGPKAIKVGCSLRWELSAVLKWIDWGCCDKAEFEAREGAENDR